MAQPEALHSRAEDNLRFIRDQMSKAAQFTAIPGWGGVVMGTSAVATALVTARIADPMLWFTWWVMEAGIAVVIASFAIARKAQRLDLPLLAKPMQRFALAYVPALAGGAVLTAVFVANGLAVRLPGVWLLLYGVAIAAGGTLSIPVVQTMGIAFMALGAAAFAAPARYGNDFMAAGFGGLHILFGFIIARKHGG